uniref:Uncharacterized protein n=1 Tax=Opuntia streptacantha TaxID=393608 RepID=A0A7C9CRZ0_OPUST
MGVSPPPCLHPTRVAPWSSTGTPPPGGPKRKSKIIRHCTSRIFLPSFSFKRDAEGKSRYELNLQPRNKGTMLLISRRSASPAPKRNSFLRYQSLLLDNCR